MSSSSTCRIIASASLSRSQSRIGSSISNLPIRFQNPKIFPNDQRRSFFSIIRRPTSNDYIRQTQNLNSSNWIKGPGPGSGLGILDNTRNSIISDSNSLSIIHRHNSSNLDQSRSFHGKPNPNAKTIPLTFVHGDGKKTTVNAEVGKSILEVAHANEIPVEGACEGSLACSTCHVVISEKLFNNLEEPCEDEEDMLDLAPELTATSRLGCQLIVDESYEGEEIKLPSHTLNFYVDGHQPMGH